MNYIDFFREEYLTPEDLLTFVQVLNLFQTSMPAGECWCIKSANHAALRSFNATHPHKARFKGRDAQALALSLVNQFYSDEKPVIVRRSNCHSFHCINPDHFFYGTHIDKQLQRQKRNGVSIDIEIIDEIRELRKTDQQTWTYKALSKKYKLPEHIIGRICRRQSYDV